MLRILIIDDETLIRSVLRSILERSGYTIMDAPNGRVALALWRHTPCDLVVTDICMPETGGSEVILQLTRVWPRAKIIAMTGGAQRGGFTSSMAPAALQFGAQHILVKPFTKLTLLAAITVVLNTGEGTSEEESRTERHISLEGGCL